MDTLVPVKMTQEEVQLLDLLRDRLKGGSRSDMVRVAVDNLAEQFLCDPAPLRRARHSRDGRRTRRAQPYGPRPKPEPPPGPPREFKALAQVLGLDSPDSPESSEESES